MSFWKGNIDQIITTNGFTLLQPAGKISNSQMETKTSELYLDFDTRRKQAETFLADKEDEAELQQLEKKLKHRPKDS